MNKPARPWGLVALVLVMLGLFVSLGVWQVNRARYKQTLVDKAVARESGAEIPLPLDLDDYSGLRYQPVSAVGRYDVDHQLLLDNQVRKGQAGYSVLTPFRIRGADRYVLVDRGWIPMGLTRQLLPDVGFTQKAVEIHGTAYTPFGKGFHLGGMDDGEFMWPRVIQFVDFGALSERLGYHLLPVIVRLSPDAPNGYLRQWKVVNMGPMRHWGYAFQWFALALAMLVILVVLFTRWGKHDGKESAP